MTKNSDRITQRIATIAAVKPIELGAALTDPRPARSERRQPVYRHGKLTLSGGAKLDCVVVDLSRNGARIELGGASGLPEFVSLTIVVTGEVHRARVAWTRENSAGLSFLLHRRGGFGGAGKAD